MSSISQGKTPQHPQTPTSEPKRSDQAHQPALRTPPSSPARPVVQRTATDTTVMRASTAPLAEVRVTKTAPASPLKPAKTTRTTDAARVSLFAKSSHADRQLAPDALSGVRKVALLLRHSEGLKLYYYEDPNVGLHIASHSTHDADAMRDKSAGKVGEHNDLLMSLKNVRHGDSQAKAQAAGTTPAKDLNFSMLLTKANMMGRAKKLSDAQGRPIVHGGTRLRFGDGSKMLLLEPSGNYGYMAPSKEAVEQMATFYANVLRHGDVAADPAVRCSVAPNLGKMVHLTEEELRGGLQILADALNQKLALPA